MVCLLGAFGTASMLRIAVRQAVLGRLRREPMEHKRRDAATTEPATPSASSLCTELPGVHEERAELNVGLREESSDFVAGNERSTRCGRITGAAACLARAQQGSMLIGVRNAGIPPVLG